MKIVYVKVSSYRNIDGITIIFNPEENFIIGGKKPRGTVLFGFLCN